VTSATVRLPSHATFGDAEAAAREVDAVARAVERGELHRESELVAAFALLAGTMMEIRRRRVTSFIRSPRVNLLRHHDPTSGA